jgi:plastocyanin
MKELRRWIMRGTFIAVVATAVLSIPGSLAQAGGGCRGEPVTTGSDLVVHFNGVCFSPTIVHIRAGATVTWANDLSKAPHTVTGANASWGSFDEVAPGSSFSHQFTTEGTYPYYCFLHAGMVGAVVVGDGNASSGNPESVSLASGAQRNPTVASALASGGDSMGHVTLFVLLSAAATGVAAAGGFVLGTRRARR